MTSKIMPTYNPLPISIEHGEGAWVYDQNKNKYLDLFAGIAVSCLGHAHPKIIQAITEQAKKVIHTSNVLTVPQQQEFAETITRVSQMDQVFFCNSGAEATETAIKVARMYGHNNNIENPTIIVADKAFHGRTMAAITASGSRKVQAGFEPLLPGFIRVPYDDLKSIEELSDNPNIVAIMIEPIQGEGGIKIPNDNYLPGIRKICDENNWLMILDEVQTGIGRTGEWFAWQHYKDAKPDVMPLAKSLGGGVPIGACVVAGKACDLLKVGNHGSTFGGNPLCCHVGNTVLREIEDSALVAHSQEIGQYLLEKLKTKLANKPNVVDIRGKGLMIGVELNRECRDILMIGLKHGILFNITALNTIRIVPPLILTKEQVDFAVDALARSIDEFG